MGPGADFAALADAVAASNPGDEIRIAGSLEVSAPVNTHHPLRFVGLGVRPALMFRGLASAKAGILTTNGSVNVDNIEFRGARSLTGNGAGIWHLAGELHVTNCNFQDNQNGLMIAAGEVDVARVAGCSFVANGAGCGHTHGIYAASGRRLDVSECSFEETRVGHHLKSRVAHTVVAGNYFGGSPSSTTSYAIDVPNGGIAEIGHNTIVKGQNSMSRKFVVFCAEGKTHAEHRLEVRSNIFISHRRELAAAVVNFAPSIPARLQGNAYEGRIVPLIGRGRDRTRQVPATAISRGAAAM